MTPEQFCYWLQGFAEITDASQISEKEWLVIVDHLNLVFEKKTPKRFSPHQFTEEQEKAWKELVKKVTSPYDYPSDNLFPPKITC